jgi:predicted aldo/keto reductase-like oxidoreductase
MQRPGEGIVAAALSFLWDHPDISTTVVGFQNVEQVRDALAAMEAFKPRTAAELAEVKKGLTAVEGLCTGCGYCDDCPQGVPIPKFMEAYNQKILNPLEKDPIGDRPKWHWNIERSVAAKCTACGQCEKACTQHLNIIERLREISSPQETTSPSGADS